MKKGERLPHTLITAREVAGLLAISPNTFRKFCKPLVPCIQKGGQSYYRRSDIMELIKQHNARFSSM